MNSITITKCPYGFAKYPKRELWNVLVLALTVALVLAPTALIAQDDDHDEEEQDSPLALTAAERQEAGISVDTVALRELRENVRVPAEVVINAYRSASVTPRMQAQVVARHVRLGEEVEPGQPLVTLSSVALADAQGELIVADREWQRVKSLGSQAVSERRYTEAQVARQQALARVLAFGMQEQQALELLTSGNASKANGDFDLLAPLLGTILRDDFIVGELIDPGRVLFEISDESILWVEASVSPTTLVSIEVGDLARVTANNTDWLEGEVVQLHHRLNETTRTQGVRIAVENSADLLHPGQFAQAEIEVGEAVPLLAVPDSALTLVQGIPVVFRLEEGGTFHPEAVETGPSMGGWTAIRAGLSEGDSIATEGVFHLKSLLLKATISGSHAH